MAFSPVSFDSYASQRPFGATRPPLSRAGVASRVCREVCGERQRERPGHADGRDEVSDEGDEEAATPTHDEGADGITYSSGAVLHERDGSVTDEL